MLPGPLPLKPAVMLSQLALLLAVQPHPVAALTVTVPIPPTAATEPLVGESEKLPEPAPWFTPKF